MLKYGALAVGLTLAAGAAQAVELKPIQAASIFLNHVNGVAYYTVEPDGFRVVATVATGQNEPMRLTAVLTDGQKLVFSVPGPVGWPPTEVGVVGEGDRLTVTDSQVVIAELID